MYGFELKGAELFIGAPGDLEILSASLLDEEKEACLQVCNLCSETVLDGPGDFQLITNSDIDGAIILLLIRLTLE